ncbi:hypothetical protein M3Y98_00628900 [Aphelenchoides besseyi]|nr:hypothetical protein M3Y98_00628900 [Aphelenchoides besseyi]KAI6208456.1 hypothetical protein M3Y96_00117200 [Aphelenchoides besseyi]
MFRLRSKMNSRILVALFSLVVFVDAYHGLSKFYSDPIKMFLARPAYHDARQQRLKAQREVATATPPTQTNSPVEANDEESELQKWKRRRATPIRISPFFYSVNPVELMLENDAASRSV